MSKKHKSGQNKQLRPSFLKQQEQRLGAGFLNRLNAEDIRKNALKIFRDLAEGSMDPNEVEQYFNQTDFTYNLLVAATDNLNYRNYVYTGLISNPQIQYDLDMQRVASELADQIRTYQSIVVHLNNILYNISMYNGVYTRYYLQELISEIRWRKNTFNGFFITLPKDSDKKRIRQERRQIGDNDKRFNNPNEGGFFNKPS